MHNTRPFFSVIVPCYNTKPERMRELLESVYEGGCPDDVQVIISNDKSTDEEFLKVVSAFDKNSVIASPTDEEYNPKCYKLDIIVVKVPDVNKEEIELIHCPGNTRQTGVSYAKGHWITFIDHDDLFVEGALSRIKDTIIENDEKYFICSNFYQLDAQNNTVIREHIHTFNWIHGKFYNLDNFWIRYNIHFITNLFGNEDTALSAQVNCVWFQLNKDKVEDISDIPTLWEESFTYVWRSWEDSTSNLLYENNINYMEKYFSDYLKGVMGNYISDYDMLMNTNQLDDKSIEYHKMMQTDVILFSYFYLQSFKFNHSNDYDLKSEFSIKKYIKDYYRRFNTTCIDFYNYIDNKEERGKWYNDIRQAVQHGVGPFVEVDSFFDFISK